MIESNRVTIAGLIKELQQSLGHDDPMMAEWLELGSEAVLRAIKTGKMRLPMDRVPLLAELLGRDPGEVLHLYLLETDEKMLHTIESCRGPLRLTQAEVSIIRAIRKVGTGKEMVPITFDRDAIVTLVVQGG